MQQSNQPDAERRAPKDLVFLLGGADLEMRAIAALVREVLGEGHLRDAELGWGASVADYGQELADVIQQGKTPVLVELSFEGDEPPCGALVVDHHGARAGAEAPTSLEQVFQLLRLPPQAWTREMALVAANDRGWIPALRQIGASEEEITRIRAEDRAAQGITTAQEAAAPAAIKAGLWLNSGCLLIDLPHGKTATVTDRLEACGQTPATLIVRSPDETNMFGPGTLIDAFDRAFPGGWKGGSLPTTGFWGIGHRLSQQQIEGVVGAV